MAAVTHRLRPAHLARRAARIGVGLVLLTSVLPPGKAEARPSATLLERQVKAAFLYKFAGYVEWPTEAFPRPDTPITIGVAGDPRLADELAQLVQGRSYGSRRIGVARPEPGASLEGIHILFIARSETSRLSEWVRAARALPVLIVTESERSRDEGSMINFVMDEGRVRFEVAIGPANRAGLQLSSGLLAVAKAVTTGNP